MKNKQKSAPILADHLINVIFKTNLWLTNIEAIHVEIFSSLAHNYCTIVLLIYCTYYNTITYSEQIRCYYIVF